MSSSVTSHVKIWLGKTQAAAHKHRSCLFGKWAFTLWGFREWKDTFSNLLIWHNASIRVIFFQTCLIPQVDKKPIDSIVEKRFLIFLFRYFAIDACGGWESWESARALWISVCSREWSVRVGSETREQGGLGTSACTELHIQATNLSLWEKSGGYLQVLKILESN